MIDWNCASFARNAASASSRLAHRDRQAPRPASTMRWFASRARVNLAHDHAPGEDQQNAEPRHDARPRRCAEPPGGEDLALRQRYRDQQRRILERAIGAEVFRRRRARSGARRKPEDEAVLQRARAADCSLRRIRRIRSGRRLAKEYGPVRVQDRDESVAADIDGRGKSSQPLWLERRHDDTGEFAVRVVQPPAERNHPLPVCCPRNGVSATEAGAGVAGQAAEQIKYPRATGR